MKYLTNNEIAVNNLEDALKLIQILTDSDYVTMVSTEEGLYIVNYIYSSTCNRNDVVFQNREELKEKILEEQEIIQEMIRND